MKIEMNGRPGLGKSQLFLDHLMRTTKPWWMPRFLWRYWLRRKEGVVDVPLTTWLDWGARHDQPKIDDPAYAAAVKAYNEQVDKIVTTYLNHPTQAKEERN